MMGGVVKKHLLLALLIAVIGSLYFSGSASASHPCFNNNNPPYGGSCLHYPDVNRANKSTIWIKRSTTNWSGDWTPALDHARSVWLSAQTKINFYAIGTVSTNCDVAPSSYNIYVCATHYSFICGANPPIPANYWLGCAIWYSFVEWNGSNWVQSNHMWGARIQIDESAKNINTGDPWVWNAHKRKVTMCHEVGGHGLGWTHNSTQPTNASCLRNTQESDDSTANTPGSHVGGEVTNSHNHNDLTCGNGTGCWWSDLSVRSQQPSLIALELLSRGKVEQAGPFKGRIVVDVPKNFNLRELPAPEGQYAKYLYIQEAGTASSLGVTMHRLANYPH